MTKTSLDDHVYYIALVSVLETKPFLQILAINSGFRFILSADNAVYRGRITMLLYEIAIKYFVENKEILIPSVNYALL